ncbi:MAG: hypothetical protein ABIS68_03775 [Casimicrobiaceae bacterium]
MNYRFDRFEVRLDARQLLIDGKPAVLGARAFDLLHAVASPSRTSPGQSKAADYSSWVSARNASEM